jgi:hypothetical protein
MKSITGKITLLTIVFVIGFLSCNKDKTSTPKESDVVKRYLEFVTKMSAFTGSSGQMSNFMNVIGASQLHNNSLKLKSMMCDSLPPDSIPVDTTGFWQYWTCAKVTDFDNNDGTHTTIYDYGDGCDEFGYLTKGKITYIWSNTGDDYYSKVLYENFYSYGMEMNGFSEYSFTSDGNSYIEYDSTGIGTDSTNITRDIIFNWSGSCTGKDSIIMTYDSGEKYSYSSNFSNKWENSTYTVLEGEYTYKSEPDGYTYHYLVTSPLIYNYECPNTWVAVTGIETIHYNDATKTYDFMIDYGNGSCDNLATITENGESSEIDFGDLLYYYCGTDSITCRNGKK